MMFLSIGSVLIGILAFIFVLAAIVLIHEGGHFFFAHKAGILCREYAFGMGPQLIHKKIGETDYAWRAFPIGGFCAISGEEKEEDPLKDKKQVRLVIENGIVTKIAVDADDLAFSNLPLYDLVNYDLYDQEQKGLFITVRLAGENKVDSEGNEIKNDEITYTVDDKAMYIYTEDKVKKSNLTFEQRQKKIKEYQNAPYNRQLNSKTIWQRFLVMFGGPLMNFVLALVVFFLSCLIGGVSNSNSTKLYDITEGSPAYTAGLRDGDIITGMEAYDTNGSVLVSNTNMTKWSDISDFMTDYKSNTNTTDVIKIYYKENSSGNALETTVKPYVIIYSISMVEDTEDSENVRVAALNESSKAYKAGIREGDIIKSIQIEDNETVNISSWKDVYTEFNKVTKAKTKVNVTVSRKADDGVMADVTFTVTPYSKNLMEDTQGVNSVEMLIGVSPVNTRNILLVVKATFKQMWSSIRQLIYTLGYLIGSSEVGVKDLSGVIGIYSMTSQAASYGFAYLLYWMGFLSVNVGFMNLLPIPALDGGRILFLIIEAIRRKPVSQKAQDIAINVTFVLLLVLMAYVCFNDILRLI